MCSVMKPIVSYEECMRDSPKFRDTLEDNHANLEDLEMKLERVLRTCNSTIDAGKTYLGHQNNLVQSILEVSLHFKGDPPVMQALNKIASSLQETVKYHSILVDQAARSVSRSLNNFIKKELKEVKETRQVFDRISTDLDTVLARHAQPPKISNKNHGSTSANSSSSSTHGNTSADEIANDLIATRSCFRYKALDHLYVVSIVQSKKRHELVDALLSYMHAQSTFFHQGSELFQDIDPCLKNIAFEVSQLREGTARLEKEMENRHSVVTSKDVVPMTKSESGNRMEGYLFKRTTNTFKTWNRRWFVIHSSKLTYRKRSGDKERTVMEADLKLCSVRPMQDIDRRYCFEVISPNKCHVLQADSEEMFHLWISALQDEIGAAMQLMLSSRSGSGQGVNTDSAATAERTPSGSPSVAKDRAGQDQLLNQILSIPGNERCCDCSAENPEWASINLGITLCISCSGIHRSLGVHLSKVRSLKWDKWDAEIAQVMVSLGNSFINSIYESKLSIVKDMIRPQPDANQGVRDLWIQAKYVKKFFVDSQWKEKEEFSQYEDTIDANWLICKGSEAGNIEWISRALALNGDRNFCHGNDLNRAPIHLAALSGSITSLQFLLLNGAKINLKDTTGKTPLLLAVESGLPAQVGLLLKNRADQNLCDRESNTPLDVAVKTANADIVSLLRLSSLNDNELEFGEGGDNTFHEMVRDFLR